MLILLRVQNNPYSDTDTLDVKFKADKGYSVTGITVDGKSFTKDEIQPYWPRRTSRVTVI